jgi:hypothetical protein
MGYDDVGVLDAAPDETDPAAQPAAEPKREAEKKNTGPAVPAAAGGPQGVDLDALVARASDPNVSYEQLQQEWAQHGIVPAQPARRQPGLRQPGMRPVGAVS